MKNHSCNLHAQICGIFCLHSVDVVCYAVLIQAKSITNCNAHLAESIFQTHSSSSYRTIQKEQIEKKEEAEMKKYLAIILSILLIASLTGCSGGTETKKKKAKESTENVLDSKNDEARMVEIGITYEKGLFVSSNEKTEISIYMDGINVGKMNADEKKIFVACLAPGKHKVKVKRTEDDEDSYEFEVEKDDGQSVVSKISIGLRYKISGLRACLLYTSDAADE